MSETPITSLELTYSVNGTSNTFTWNARTIPFTATDTIYTPAFSITPGQNHTVSVTITKINEEDYNSPAILQTLKKNTVNYGGDMTFKLTVDSYGETYFALFNPDGTVLLQGGPWSGAGTRTSTFAPRETGCYVLEVYDSYGDGITALQGIQLLNADNTVLISTGGDFGYMTRYMIDVDWISEVQDIAENNTVSVYPNPANTQTTIALSLTNDAKVNVALYNVYGQQIQILTDSTLPQGENKIIFDVTKLSPGVYFAKVIIDNEIYTQKITVQ